MSRLSDSIDDCVKNLAEARGRLVNLQSELTMQMDAISDELTVYLQRIAGIDQELTQLTSEDHLDFGTGLSERQFASQSPLDEFLDALQTDGEQTVEALVCSAQETLSHQLGEIEKANLATKKKLLLSLL